MIPPSSIGVRKRISVIVPLHEVANSAATPRSAVCHVSPADQYSIQSAPSATFSSPSSYADYSRHLPTRKNKRLRSTIRSSSPPQVTILPCKNLSTQVDSTFCKIPSKSSHQLEQDQARPGVQADEESQRKELEQTAAPPSTRTTVSPCPSSPGHSNTIFIPKDTFDVLVPEQFYPQPQSHSQCHSQEQIHAQLHTNSQVRLQTGSLAKSQHQFHFQSDDNDAVSEGNHAKLAQCPSHLKVKAQFCSPNHSLAQPWAFRRLSSERQINPEFQAQVQVPYQLPPESEIETCKDSQTHSNLQKQTTASIQASEEKTSQPQIGPDVVPFFISKLELKLKSSSVKSPSDDLVPVIDSLSSKTPSSELSIAAHNRSNAPLSTAIFSVPCKADTAQDATTGLGAPRKSDALIGQESIAFRRGCAHKSTDVMCLSASCLNTFAECDTAQKREDGKEVCDIERSVVDPTTVEDLSLTDVKDGIAVDTAHSRKHHSRTHDEIVLAVNVETSGDCTTTTESANAVVTSPLGDMVEGHTDFLSTAPHKESCADSSAILTKPDLVSLKPLTESNSTSVAKKRLEVDTHTVRSVPHVIDIPKPESVSHKVGDFGRRAGALESLSCVAVKAGSKKRRPRSPDVTFSQDTSRQKKRRVEKENDVVTSDSSISQIPEEFTTEALLRITAAARQRNVVWTKVKGHPFWPTQVVDLTSDLEAEPRFSQASRFRRKGDNTCVMYFGTCEIAFVNRGRACLTWNEGIRRNYHTANQGRPNFQRALSEVKHFCSRAQRYPRGWWNEPDVLVLHADFIEKADESNLHPDIRPMCSRADTERVCWAKIRGFPHWPVQILPHNMAADCYPELKLGPDSNRGSAFPCMFFGTAEVAVVPEKNIVPFLAGISRGYLTDSDRRDFVIALGEVWGYLLEPRIWPSGHLSGKSWWNYIEQSGKTGRSDNDSLLSVPHMPHYDHIKKSVWGDGVEPIPKPKKADIACCECHPENDQDCCVESSCLNFASNFLCSASCRAGRFCKNVNFHKRKSPRMTPFFTADQRGWGLKVEELVRRGDFVVEYVGEIIDRDVLEKRLKIIDKEKSTEYYMMDLTNDLLVDAKFKGNLSRFINSSCEPNCQTQKWTDPVTGQTHVGIFAIQDISPGTELTYNYCFLDFGLSAKRGKRSFSCHCGTASCCMLKPVEQDLMRKYIGKRIEVRWDDGWYPGFVETYNLKKKRFRVQYDDGDCEDLALGLRLGDKIEDVPFRLVEEKGSGEDPKGRNAIDLKNRTGSELKEKNNFDIKMRNETDDKRKSSSDSKCKHSAQSKVKSTIELRGRNLIESKKKHKLIARIRKG